MDGLVSAVITTHNRKEFLIKALHSALNQTYANMELFVVDDRSTDGTKEYIETMVRSLNDEYHIPVNYIYNVSGGVETKQGTLALQRPKANISRFWMTMMSG